MATPVVRAFRPDDVAALEHLWLAAWQATMPDIDFIARLPWLREHLATLSALSTMIVAELNGMTVGFLTVEPNGYVDQLVADPSYWGAGIGTALLDEAKRLSPIGLTLTVNAENPRAVMFYRKHGFLEADRGSNPASGRPVIFLRWGPPDVLGSG